MPIYSAQSELPLTIEAFIIPSNPSQGRNKEFPQLEHDDVPEKHFQIMKMVQGQFLSVRRN